MSPDRTTITRAEAIRRRKEEQARRLEEASNKNSSVTDALLSTLKTVVKNTNITPASRPAPKEQTTQAPGSPYRTTPAHRQRPNPNEGAQTQEQPTYPQDNGYAQPMNMFENNSSRGQQSTVDTSVSQPTRTARVRRVAQPPSTINTGTFNRPRVQRAQQSTPAFSLPHIDFTSRWVAIGISVVALALCYLLLYTPLFAVQRINVIGATNVNPGELIGSLGAMEKQLITLDWAQLRTNILASYPQIADANLSWGFPNSLNVAITERIPVAEWRQDGQSVWIDQQGYAFPVGNAAQAVPAVQANGPAPAPSAPEDAATQPGVRPFLYPTLVQAIKVVSATVPQGTILMYDPNYGLGWTDPQGGWQVYYGSTEGNNEEKVAVYNALVADLTAKGVHPTLINVEYPNSPFYQTADGQSIDVQTTDGQISE